MDSYALATQVNVFVMLKLNEELFIEGADEKHLAIKLDNNEL